MKFDKYENEILESVEANEWVSKSDTDKRLKELQNIVKNRNKKAISVRVNQNDIYELKKKAMENSIPYQSIIQMLIHQYASNKIKLEV
ncbi:MAG: antitoxin [Epsilonproteobacteria bacterium]|nr:antitoxin [Campylobacterota bacterium]